MPDPTGESLGLPTGGSTPDMMQQIMKMISMARPQQSPDTTGGAAGVISPAQVGQPGGGAPVPNVGGMQPPQGVGGVAPSPMTPGASAGGPARFPQFEQPNQQTEFRTAAGRNAAVTQNALAAVSSGVREYKQKKYQETMQTAKASVLNKVMQSQDPQARQQMEKLAKSDPKIAKILQKQDADFAKSYDKAMTDPNSPEYYGFQQAYQELQQQAAFKDKMEQVKAQVARDYAEAQQRGAEARQKQAMIPRNEQERGVMMGTLPSADIKEQAEQRKAKAAQDLEYKRDALAQQRELTLQRLDDKKTSDQDKMQLARELANMRHLDTMMRLEQMRAAKEEKSKIPSTLITRLNQAEIIKEQIDDLRQKMKDPELLKYMGPIVGQGAFISRRINSKVSDFIASQQSLDALLPILHGYRGGSQMHQVFSKAIGDMTLKPEAYEGSLKGLEGMADNIVKEMHQLYPDDALWKAEKAAGGVTPPAAEPMTIPKAGDVVDGYRFKGGDVTKQDNWEAVAAKPSAARP